MTGRGKIRKKSVIFGVNPYYLCVRRLGFSVRSVFCDEKLDNTFLSRSISNSAILTHYEEQKKLLSSPVYQAKRKEKNKIGFPFYEISFPPSSLPALFLWHETEECRK